MTVYNHLLFSEIFFQQIRQETTDLDNLRATLSTIRATWQYYLPPPPGWDGPIWVPSSPFPPDDVAQLRTNVVEQIFAYLELTYGPCEGDSSTALTSDRTFFLYADWSQQDRTGLCLVLPYSADIEGRDPQTNIVPKGRNYAQQLIRLLDQYDLDWGVLTNGRHWRLFHRAELSPTEAYLHVDLERILITDDVQNYIVFHRFFSRPAFARQARSERSESDGRQRLDLYKGQSDKATKVIEDHLSAHVEEIARQLCQGLVESCRMAGEDVTAPETRTAIYKNALFLIYRLLFVLYAEARDLLPLDVSAYRAVCLRDLLAEVRENHKHGLNYDDDYAIWERLQALFALIDQGDPTAGVPAYNGGLFDPGRRPFLTRHRVRNDYLQAALIRLVAIPSRGQTYDQDREPQPIDYRDLSVRHLGSLYEGLLEYNLFVVEDEPRVVRVGQKKTQYLPYSQAGKVRASETVLPVGAVYFSETAGERKATGSYYTPEDVVDYIVRHTVGEKLAELKAGFYEEQAIERQLADLADTPADVPAHRQIQAVLDDQFLRFVRQKVLDLKILDPAMGSGHFLVNATHTVADFVVELLNETPWENAAIDTDVATWKRRVAERCIFGVDLNELAVELAKLCLWMTTAAKGKPLTFLDHHLRWGNSLVGAWLKDVGVYPLAKKESEGAFTLPLERFQVDLDEVLAAYETLYAKSSDDVDEVREKARIFDEEIYPALQPYRELLDLHTGVYFFNDLGEETYAEMGDAVSDLVAWARLKAEELGDLLAQHAGRRWFHWELEFPEVFAAERGGFDAVVGNPPYVRQEGLGQDKAFFQASHAAYHGMADLYVYFFDRGLSLTRPAGRLGLITSNKFMRASYGGPLRKRLSDNVYPEQIVDFAQLPLFPGLTVRTAIYVLENAPANGRATRFAPVRSLDYARLDDEVAAVQKELAFGTLTEASWSLASTDEDAVLRKMETVGLLLGEYVKGQIFSGVKTGCNEAFIVDAMTRAQLIAEDPHNAEIIKPAVVGQDIGRYEIDFANRYLIWTYVGIDIERYPAIERYLSQFRERLEKRSDKGDNWYELRPCSYYEEFAKPKIMYPDIARTSRFAYDETGLFCNNTAYIIPVADLYLLAVLNSSLALFYLKSRSAALEDAQRRAYLRFIDQYVRPFPVCRTPFTTPEVERTRLVEIGTTDATEWIEGTENDSVGSVVFSAFSDSAVGRWLEARLAVQPEQADAVHDLLAHLAREMMELHKRKQAETKRFLAWIESELLTEGVGVNDLNGKTFVQSYHDQPPEKLVEVLGKNWRRLRTSPEVAAAQLRPAYEESLAVLGPLLRRIARTDRLIDFIVYRLYGLTEEEVVVVEGTRQ